MATQTEVDTFSAQRRVVTLVHGAIAGASIAAALELASRETLSPLLLTALGCFAVAVPTAIALVVLSQVIYEFRKPTDKEFESQYWPVLSSVLAVVDQLTCYLGFLALFWHFHWIIGLIFLATTILAYLTAWLAEKGLRKGEK